MEMKQNQTFFIGHIQIWHHIFFNGSKTKSDIFTWDIFKPDFIFHWLKNTKTFQ